MVDVKDSRATKLEEQFWSIAQQTAEFQFYELTPQRTSFLRDVIREGINKIIAENRMNDERSIKLAEDHLMVFVTKLAEKPEIESTGKALDFSEFRSTRLGLSDLCPCWPFC